jgi:hypothetical protein
MSFAGIFNARPGLGLGAEGGSKRIMMPNPLMYKIGDPISAETDDN